MLINLKATQKHCKLYCPCSYCHPQLEAEPHLLWAPESAGPESAGSISRHRHGNGWGGRWATPTASLRTEGSKLSWCGIPGHRSRGVGGGPRWGCSGQVHALTPGMGTQHNVTCQSEKGKERRIWCIHTDHFTQLNTSESKIWQHSCLEISSLATTRHFSPKAFLLLRFSGPCSEPCTSPCSFWAFPT